MESETNPKLKFPFDHKIIFYTLSLFIVFLMKY